MKKILLSCILAIVAFSCAKDEIPVPAALMIEELDLTLVAEGETYRNRFYTTAATVNIVIPEDAVEWLHAIVDDGYLVITADRNASIGIRASSLEIVTPEREATVNITQQGLPTKLIKITGGVPSSSQSSEGMWEYTWDGDRATYWHSQYSAPSAQYNDHLLQWDLESGTGSLDLIITYPRNNVGAANGRTGYFCIYVKGDGTDVPGGIEGEEPDWDWGDPLGTVDADGYKLVYKGDDTFKQNAYGGPTIMVLPTPINHPTSVKMLFRGGPAGATGISRGGHGSLAEMELYGKVG
ncbi:MAG: hypothetical protein LBD52_06750 [Prevotellaceae bacterium]|jgi:hypothetical protein|nr:hypothetical protein [Prevotellaceae bacterium]